MIQKTNGKVKTAILSNLAQQMECYCEDSFSLQNYKKKEWDFDKAPLVAVSMGSTEVDVHHV